MIYFMGIGDIVNIGISDLLDEILFDKNDRVAVAVALLGNFEHIKVHHFVGLSAKSDKSFLKHTYEAIGILSALGQHLRN
jgi:hypothetical protein